MQWADFESEVKTTKGYPKISSAYSKATTGFEPVNIGFANQPLKPLGYVASLFEF